ncbi:hypothetical protein, partial [Streptomyces inusitatus]|uniref:hypothetical protein n=1 Tax=Streptomyces inusitatus TaxID=68221 RepID=UPI001E52AD97
TRVRPSGRTRADGVSPCANTREIDPVDPRHAYICIALTNGLVAHGATKGNFNGSSDSFIDPGIAPPQSHLSTLITIDDRSAFLRLLQLSLRRDPFRGVWQ